MVDMRHQRHADLFSDLKRDVERHDPRGARGVEPYPHFDADDEVAKAACPRISFDLPALATWIRALRKRVAFEDL
jgi:hypothetical protein